MQVIRIVTILLIGIMLVLGACTSPPSSAGPPQTSPVSTQQAPSETSPSPEQVKSPPITVAVDYFGIRNTHYLEQVAGDRLARIQLIVVVSDERGTLAVWPPPSAQNLYFDMDYFQIEALKEKLNPPVVFNGSATGTLAVYVAAYNVNKGPITKAQIDILSNWLGFPDLNRLKDAIPDKELVGYYWQTWTPLSNWGVGESYSERGDGDLRVWLRIGADQMPEPAQQPVLKPNVKIEDVKLPSGTRVRQPSEQYSYKVWDFAFTIANNEAFTLPVYWHLESSYKPETKVFPYDYPTEGVQTIPGNGKVTVKVQFWFTVPGSYQWKYIVGYPKGNAAASWTGTLMVSR